MKGLFADQSRGTRKIQTCFSYLVVDDRSKNRALLRIIGRRGCNMIVAPAVYAPVTRPIRCRHFRHFSVSLPSFPSNIHTSDPRLIAPYLVPILDESRRMCFRCFLQFQIIGHWTKLVERRIKMEKVHSLCFINKGRIHSATPLCITVGDFNARPFTAHVE